MLSSPADDEPFTRIVLGTAGLPKAGSVAVLLHDGPADMAALDHAIEAAEARNGRLLVVIVPLFSRWLAGWALTPACGISDWTPVDKQETEAIERCMTLTLQRVPQDTPVTIYGVQGARTAIVAKILADVQTQFVVAANPPRPRWIVSWHGALARRYRKTQRRATASFDRLPSLVMMAGRSASRSR